MKYVKYILGTFLILFIVLLFGKTFFNTSSPQQKISNNTQNLESYTVTNVIVGAGLSGIVMAERLANELQEDVLIIEKRPHIGGNCYDYKDENGITIQKYGPHIFHTNNQLVWDYLSQFTKWHYFFLKPQVIINNQAVSLPFNLNTMRQVFPETLAARLEEKLINQFGYDAKVPILELQKEHDSDLKFLAQFIYDKVFKNYTEKQWGIQLADTAPSVSARVPVVVSRNDGYFSDKYQGIPLDGYTAMMTKMLQNPRIKVVLNTDFNEVKERVHYKRLFFTGSIDAFFHFKRGVLPYRSLTFDVQEKNIPYYQKTAVVNYPNNYDFTRITEHKYFLNEQSDKTVISIEYPSAFEPTKNERYYPIENPQNQSLFQQYKTDAAALKNVWFLGRLGDYKYYNMDEAVARALFLFETNIKR